MRRLRALLLLIPLLAVPAGALDFRRVGELRLSSGGLISWLDPRGVLLMKKEWVRTPSGGRRVTFVVADVRTQELLRLPFDLEAFARARPALFDSVPDVELVHFDGTTGLLRFDRREPARTVSHYAFWTPGVQALSEPVPLGETLFRKGGRNYEVSRLTYFVGADPAQGRLYFADVAYDDRPRPENGPLRIRFFRVTPPELREDWELELTLPRRARQLKAETYRVFSPDGKRFAIAEYYDAEIDRKNKAVPPPQVYVLDLERRKVDRYEIPTTPYGLAFSRDGRYLAVGSHEDAVIIRIDLEAGRVDRRVKAQAHIQAFAAAAVEDALVVLSDHIGAPRSIEIRRWSDLGLVRTVSPSSLFPGVAGIHPETVRATADGRLLVFPRYKADGYPDTDDKGIVTFALEPGAARGGSDMTALVGTHIGRAALRLYKWQVDRTGNHEGFFAPFVAVGKGEAFVIGTLSDLPEDAPYEDGKSQPYAIWVDAAGKVVWEKSLRSGKRFIDYQGGSAVATPDGAVLAFVLAYPCPGCGASSRVVKLDRKGKSLWEWTSPDGREARFAEQLQLLDSGIVRMKGHVGTSSTPWLGELDAKTGRLIRDEVGKAP